MKKAVIIGAGPAGLTAAYELLEKSSDWHVTILEASDVIGGISQTAVHGKCRIDIGGHRFFSKSEKVNEIWSKLMPIQGAPAWDDSQLKRKKPFAVNGPDPETTDKVMLIRDRVSRIFYLRHFFDYPIALKLQTFLNMGLGRTWKAGWSYLHAAFFKRPEKSLEDFYINRFGKELYAMFFEDYTEKLWGVHPSQISPEWGAQRVKGLSLWKAILNILKPKGAKRETSLIESFIYPKKGPGQLWEILAEEVQTKGAVLHMNACVTKIEKEGDTITAVMTADGTRYACDAVFSSMPIKDLVATFETVPTHVAEVASHLPYRDFITVGLLVDKLAIQNETKIPTLNNLVPDTWIYVQERDVRIGRLQIFNNWSPYMVDDPSKHVWIGLEYFCAEGDTMWEMSDDAFIRFAVAELKKVGVIAEDEAIRDSVRIRIKKAYPAYFGSYARFGEVRIWLNTISNLYCIGRNGQHRYNNMDHSMLCGIEAVQSLLTNSDKSAVWNVNIEEEYHESK